MPTRGYKYGDTGITPIIAEGMANFLQRLRIGHSLGALVSIAPPVAKGLSLRSTAADYQGFPTRIGNSLTHLLDSVIKAPLREGFTTGSVLTVDPSSITHRAGSSITRITYSLQRNVGASSAASTGTWTNPNNATGNSPDSANASNANTALAAASGDLTLTYPVTTNKTLLTISSVKINVFANHAAGVVSPGTYTLAYSLNSGSSYTTVDTGSGSNTFAPLYDITTAVGGDWTKIDGFRFRITYTAPASATVSTMTVDAVRLEVTASLTQTL